ncbi:MAG TPA: SPFH domain-containing protein [Phycisphaerae bacterium]|nr:SPFH domain-containing protein [Phycisphaerae bacterium]HNU46432.1 SPFH domain-containing protein [Phycisphaerae bacterium]
MSEVVGVAVRRRQPTRWTSWVIPLLAGGIGLLVLLVMLLWFVVRIEVNANELLVLVQKTGRKLPADLPPELRDQVVLYPELLKAIVQRTGQTEEQVKGAYKGIHLEVLPEGRYFINPYSYTKVKMPATIISQNEMGVLIRKFGRALPFPKTVATEPDERGPVAEYLTPGRHNINLLAYDVLKFPAVQIPEGHVGVVTLLSGTDPVAKNTYTVEPGEKGVQRKTLPPGWAYYNPYLQRIETIDLRSHKYDLLGEEAIQFPSNDSFTITIEGTIEWAIRPDQVAEVIVAYGDEDDILHKVIIPNARSISRIEGSKLQAREFISGRTRTAFQDSLLAQLKRECWNQGIDIKSALVRDIHPPAEIAALISQREQADQEIERFTNEMEEARAQARLIEQQEMQEQNKSVGDARRQVVTLVKEAEKRKSVAVTEANQALAVAKLTLEAAEKEAAATRARGAADAKVILLEYQAQAEPLQQAVQAFGDGQAYAQMHFLQKIAPAVRSILANTDGPFAEIFRQLQDFTPTTGKGGAP